jgi:EAL domain-containing protein (putative c-di-GMP-specific phosphodiesterase class I)
LTLSIGLATTTLVVGGDLLASASDARQSAKHTGGSRALYYEDSMEANATSGFRLANDLHHAITHEQLRLHYQPIMEFATNEITGVEALVRWERPGVGLLAPDLFIDAAERTGQIVQLGKWVVRTACQNAWKLGSHSGGARTMSINISARQLRDPGLIATLREAMLENECAPSTIIIEVTESVLLEDLSTIVTSLEEIKSLDIGVDLDDFGTGYSSLQYLRSLPIDRLKVDQGFVAGLGVNGADTAIVASTIALAHALGLSSIAEGVETPEQLALLREMGCDFAQGYLLSRPVEMDTFTAWLEAYVPAEISPPASTSIAESLRERGDAADRRDAKANRRETKANRRDTKADARETRANTRDVTATTRDTAANTREARANSRDVTATTRDTAANTRETMADTRATAADTRETRADTRATAADTRATAADTRDATADERERLADLRDATATDREQARGSSGEAPPDEESQ